MTQQGHTDKDEAVLITASDPLFNIENQCRGEGFLVIGGIDEAGRGALIGPVVAAGVIFPSDCAEIPYVNDSKQISEPDRDCIRQRLLAVPGIRTAIAEVTAAEIDRMNILQATLLAMRRVAEQLYPVDLLLIDGNRRPKGIVVPLRTIVKGDAKSASIAAASLLAKTHRDDILRAYARQYPHYGFEHHKGYGTVKHLDAIARYGILPEHRRTFAPVRDFLSPFTQDNLF